MANLWGASETDNVGEADTIYGRNKALSECAVLAALGGRALVLRLSNVFGYEYNSAKPRRTFLALMLSNLRNAGVIRFDMRPNTRRDFIPAEICAQHFIEALECRLNGVYNLGGGLPVACGEIAGWVMEGSGGGRLISTQNDVRDEFFLNMDKWHARFPASINMTVLKDYAIELGRRLKDE
jgi:nucleoside-diphosphate-sugar epimerase